MFGIVLADRRQGAGSVLSGHRVQQLPHGLLAGLGKPGDGIDLLLDPGGGAALAGKPDAKPSNQQLAEREIEQLSDAREQRRGGAAASRRDGRERHLGADWVSRALVRRVLETTATI